MVDIHSHILPGLDDGPAELGEAVEMVRMAAAGGTTDIVASPHANIDFAYDPVVVMQKIDELRQASGDVVRIHRGCDLHLSASNIEDALDHPAKYTINAQRYLLVEFSDWIIPPSIDTIFRRFRSVGIAPIITHPERNGLLQQNIPKLVSWISEGCLVQVTAQSFLGRFGPAARRSAEELMRRGLIHFIASDAHDVNDRRPLLDQAYHALATSYGENAASTLFVDNPRAALVGAEVVKTAPKLASNERTALKRLAGSLWRS